MSPGIGPLEHRTSSLRPSFALHPQSFALHPQSFALHPQSFARYPVSATQWHPEKNIFEWSPGLRIPHDPVAVLITQAVANAFVNRSRKNGHASASLEEENELLIYNWSQNLEFTGRRGGVFDQVYTFAPWAR